MNIDIESIGLLSLILQDSPKDRQLILCVLARANTAPTRIKFHSNTDYPTFYGYSNERIPYCLMGKGVLSNVPREGHIKRLISSHYLSYAETVINRAKNWDIHQKGMSISKFITLDNKTAYKDAEVFLVFRDKTLDYIKDYADSHNEEVSSFFGIELSGEVSKTVTNSGVYYPQTIPDRTSEFEKLARKVSEREHQRNLDERRRREDTKTARILASTKDKYLHAVDLISEYAEMAKNSQTTRYADNGTTFSIPYYFFNFEGHIKVRDLLEAFLFKLKNAGCFENFNRSPATPLGSSMVFHKIKLYKLKEYRDTMIKGKENNGLLTGDIVLPQSRRGLEKKWDVLQAIWTVYESNSRADSILVPIATLVIKGRDVQEIDGIIEGLRKEGCFAKWERRDRWYNLEFINHEMLPKVYQEVGNTYKKFNVAHEQKNESGVTETQEQTKPTLPSDWELIEKDNIPQILKADDVVFTFPNNWSNKHKYFKCLWNNYGVKITYKEIYEFESNKLKYPDKHITSTNRNIRSTIHKLRKEFKELDLPINIKTNKGFTLTI